MTAQVETACPRFCANPACKCVEVWLGWRARGEGWLSRPAKVVTLTRQAVKRADSVACRTSAEDLALDDGDMLSSLRTLRQVLVPIATEPSEHVEASGGAA